MGFLWTKKPTRVNLCVPLPAKVGYVRDPHGEAPSKVPWGGFLFLLGRSDALPFEHLDHELPKRHALPDRRDLEPYMLALGEVDRHPHEALLATTFSWTSRLARPYGWTGSHMGRI